MATNDGTCDGIEAGRARLAALRPAVQAGAPWPLSERFDDAPEATWGPPEVLAHVDEMLGFWHGELDRIVDARSDEPVPFGRISTDAARLAAIERERRLPLDELDASIDAKAAALDRRLLRLVRRGPRPRRAPPAPRRGDRRVRARTVHLPPPRGPRGPARTVLGISPPAD